jgi:hypothetical protein
VLFVVVGVLFVVVEDKNENDGNDGNENDGNDGNENDENENNDDVLEFVLSVVPDDEDSPPFICLFFDLVLVLRLSLPIIYSIHI